MRQCGFVVLIALAVARKSGCIVVVSREAVPLTEFEYTDRLAELLASLQNDVIHALRSRWEEITRSTEERDLATECEFKRQISLVNEHLQRMREENEANTKKLLDHRRQEEESRIARIRHYQRSLTDARQNLTNLRHSLEAKHLPAPIDATSLLSTSATDDSKLDNLIQEASEVFREAQALISGPLAHFDGARFIFQKLLVFAAVGGFSGFLALLQVASQIHVSGIYTFWAFVIGCGAVWGLKASMGTNKESVSELLGYPEARRGIASAVKTFGEQLRAMEKAVPKRIDKIEFEKKSKMSESDRLLAEAKESFDRAATRIRSDQAAIEQQHQVRLENDRNAAEKVKSALSEEFMPRVAERHRAIKEFWRVSHQASAEWSDPIWRNWQPDPSPEFAARLGKLVLEDMALAEAFPELNLKFELPGLMPFASGRFLLFEAKGNARPYVEAIQSLMLRALANVPPGKLRFTFIDPVGLGQSVAPFMALGDLDEQLISGRAWSESQHIEQQLGKLTEHMEMVIQKYLRHDYASITDYNHAAKEVAEAFRFLVIFDFPTNFNDSALHRLVSIIRNGPRCGIFTLLVRSTAKPLPYGFNFDAELRPFAFAPYHQLAH